MKRIRQLMICVLMILILAVGSMAAICVVNSEQQKKSDQKKKVTREELKDWAAPDEKVLDYYGLGEFSTTLPVIYINTKGQQILKENKIWGNVALLNADKDGEEQSVYSVPGALYRATVKYRGASSYSNFEKKQYRIKFYKDKTDSAKNVALAGMGENSEWVLNGPYLDKTLVRNKLVYDLSRELNGWAPDSRFVEVFVDGKYQGVYLAVEPVTNGDSRLRLAEFGLLSGETAYIVKRDRIDTENLELETYGKLYGHTHNALYLTYPSENKVTEKQKSYVLKDISDFEKALYGEDFQNLRTGYMSYIDTDNWVDYFIINEFAMNYDAGNLSTYAYKELGGKLQLAVWDYNNGFDNYQWYRVDTDEFRTVKNSWMNRVCQDRKFIERVISRYKDLRKNTLSEEHIFQKIEAYKEELGNAVERNFKVWEYSFEENLLIGKNKDGSSRDIKSYEEAVEQLKTTIHKRLLFLDEHIEDLYGYCRDGKEPVL